MGKDIACYVYLILPAVKAVPACSKILCKWSHASIRSAVIMYIYIDFEFSATSCTPVERALIVGTIATYYRQLTSSYSTDLQEDQHSGADHRRHL